MTKPQDNIDPEFQHLPPKIAKMRQEEFERNYRNRYTPRYLTKPLTWDEKSKKSLRKILERE